MFPILLIALLLVAPAASGAEEPRAAAANETAVDLAAIESFLTATYPADEPGAAVIITRGGDTLLRAAYGMADLELSVPLEPGMVFRLGSITKQFTGAAIMLLAEEGKIELSDLVTEYLPDYPVGDAEITLEHLLTHTSGLFNYTSIPGYMNELVRRDLTTAELLDAIDDQPRDFAPGERWAYSNTGYVLLGAVIEEASGMTYADFVRTRVFEPLGMEHSHYGGPQLIARRVSGYMRQPDGGYINAPFLSMTQPHAAGSLLSTVDDLARWDAALFDGELLSPESVRRMTTRYRLNDGTQTDYGYGFSLSTFRGRPVIQHGGGIFGFNTFAMRFAEEELFVAVLSNTNGREMSPGPVALKIAAIAAGDPLPEWTRKPVDAAELERLAGLWTIEDDGGIRKATFEDGRLYTQRGGGPRLEAIPAGDGVFFYDNSLTWFRVVDEEGTPVMLVHQDGGDEPERAVWSGELESEPERVEVELTLEQMADAAGRYELAPGFVLTITVEEGGLMSQATGQPKVPIYAESADRLFLKVVDAQLELQRDAAGVITGLVLYQNGQEIPAKKLP